MSDGMDDIDWQVSDRANPADLECRNDREYELLKLIRSIAPALQREALTVL